MLEKAIKIAIEAHSGQLDKAGQPYILHPLRCMLKVETDIQRISAVLHDVVEDTDWTIEALQAEGFSKEVLEIVERVSRREDESYDEFIERVKGNKDAVAVKISDLEDNMNIARLFSITEKDRKRLDKYIQVWRKLKVL
ncbi:MAG: HD domain-containing protein [Solidesulfovibrio sp. DCME]|uniref:HD domain-containing protein n=1 Tax=Solidesulfovibrio sp. DCME TaxID=3447380 RepID=UPI003D109F55